MGWRTTTVFFPSPVRISQIFRVVWDLPQPVLTAHTAITGLAARSMVWAAPGSMKSAPAAMTWEALCISSR